MVKTLGKKLGKTFLSADERRFNVIHSHPDLYVTGFEIMPKSNDIELELKKLYSQIEDFKQKTLSNEEFKQIKNAIRSDRANLYESALSLSNAFAQELFLSSSIDIEKEMQILDKLTPNDIKEAAQKTLDLSKVSLVVLHPHRKKENISFKGILNISDEIELKEYVLPNNLRVIFDEAKGSARSAVSFTIASKEKLHANPKTYYLLLTELGNEKAEEIYDQNNINFSIYGNNQYISTKTEGLPEQLEFMLSSILENIVHHDFGNFANFYKNETEKLKLLGSYSESLQGKFDTEIYKGCEECPKSSDLSSITSNDVQKLNNSILQNGQARVVITLPISFSKKNKQNILNMLSLFPKFQPDDYTAMLNISKAQPLEKSKVFLEPNNEKQLSIEQTYKIIKSGNIKDIAGINILNVMIGLSENNLLHKKLREEKQLSYSPYSELRDNFYTQNLNTLTLKTQVSATNKRNLQTVLDEYKNIADILMSNPIDERRLSEAKKYLKNTIFNCLESTSDRNRIVDQSINSFYGVNYFSELEKAIDSITSNDICELAKYYFSKPSLYMISGNQEAIEANMDYLQSLGEVF